MPEPYNLTRTSGRTSCQAGGPSRRHPGGWCAPTRKATLQTVGVDHCSLRSVVPGEAPTGTQSGGRRPTLWSHSHSEWWPEAHTPTESGREWFSTQLYRRSHEWHGGTVCLSHGDVRVPVPRTTRGEHFGTLRCHFWALRSTLKPALTRPAGDVPKTTVIHSHCESGGRRPTLLSQSHGKWVAEAHTPTESAGQGPALGVAVKALVVMWKLSAWVVRADRPKHPY